MSSKLYDYFAGKAFIYKITPLATRGAFRKKADAVCAACPAIDRQSLRYTDYRRAHRLVRCTTGEFFEYELYGKDDAYIRSFITMYSKHLFLTQLGDPHAAKTILGSKRAFNRAFAAFLGRAWLDPAESTPEDFRQFLQTHGTVILKATGAYQGNGIRKYSYTDAAAADELYPALIKEGCIVEECLRQHPQLAALNPATVNTLRISTITKNGEVHFVGACLKMGCGEGTVDNLVKGGIGCAVDVETGVVTSDGFGHDLRTYRAHPVSGIALKGMQLPLWDVVRATVRDAARFAEEGFAGCHWVGWDIAVTPTGAAVIEGNWNQGLNLIQCHQSGKFALVRSIINP